MKRGIVFYFLIFCIYGLRAQEPFLSQFQQCCDRGRAVEARLVDAFQAGSWDDLNALVGLRGRELSAWQVWIEEIKGLRASCKMVEAKATLPVMGGGDEKAMIVNGRVVLSFMQEDSVFARRFGFPVLGMRLDAGAVPLLCAMELSPLKPVREVRMKKAAIEAVPDIENQAVTVRADWELEATPGLPQDTITFYLYHPLDFSAFHADGRIRSVQVNPGQVRSLPVAQILLTLNAPLKPGEILHLETGYQADFAFHHLGRKPVGFTADRGFILCESGWYPHFSQDWVSFPCQTRLDLPMGWRGLAPGELVSAHSKGGRERIAYTAQIPDMPYLVWGRYEVKALSLGGMPLEVWTPSDGHVPAEPLLDPLRRAFDSFSRRLPTPRLKNQRMVAVTRFGGYGPKGNLLLQDGYFASETAGKPETLEFVAHELSHSWINSLAEPVGEESLFLSEGLATYLGMEAVEATLGKEAASALWRGHQDQYNAFLQRAAPPLGIGDVQFTDNRMFRAVAYDKGAYFWRELESILGEESVMAVLGNSLIHPSHEGMTFLQILDGLRRLDPSKMNHFQSRFLAGVSLPDWEVQTAQEGGLYLKNLGSPVEGPVTVMARDASGNEQGRMQFAGNSRESRLPWLLNESICSIEIDPDRCWLQSESRNDVYPRYLVDEADARAVGDLVASLIRAFREKDGEVVDRCLSQDPQQLSPRTRRQLVQMATSSRPMPFELQPSLRFFATDDGRVEVEGVALLAVPKGKAQRYRLVVHAHREEGGWRCCDLRLTL